MFDRLKDFTLRFAHHRHAEWWLFFYAIIESFFFPVPPDLLLIALTLARPTRGQHYALITMIGSVLGGLVGYCIGRFGFHLIAEPILTLLCQKDPQICPDVFVPYLQSLFDKHGFWVVGLSAMSPLIPYKLMILVAGFAHMALAPFIIVSAIVHWARYALVCFIVARYGRKALHLVQDQLPWVFGAIGTLALVIYIAANYF
jgi:membrane protein YqaA with SNARE-associated domain